MKQLLLPVLVSLLIIPACRKPNTNSVGLSGSWKLIEVYDKNTTATSFPPASSNKDVIITFKNGNSFSGNTLVNTVSDGTFELTGNKITFGSFSMTKVMEDNWGGSFLTVLHACPLQSIHPCAPSEITIEGNKMKINSVMRYNITLQKL